MREDDMVMDTVDDDVGLDDDEKRIAEILVPGQKIDELPDVSWEMLEKYYHYIKNKLPEGMLLTGQDSLGYFSWEERFEWGHGSEKEREQCRQHQASYQDTFTLLGLKNIDITVGIVATVLRGTDNKKFEIPLVDLVACKPTSRESVLLDDYSIWFINYSEECE